ncbi:hypothetical protein SK128_023034, partial [Halocaridina rubra]
SQRSRGGTAGNEKEMQEKKKNRIKFSEEVILATPSVGLRLQTRKLVTVNSMSPFC